jgi:hypothetical protein
MQYLVSLGNPTNILVLGKAFLKDMEDQRVNIEKNLKAA